MKKFTCFFVSVFVAGVALLVCRSTVSAQITITPSFRWASKLTGDGSAGIFNDYTKMAVDDNQNVYVVDAFSGTIDFDDGSGVHELTAGEMQSIYIRKSDSSGNFKWVKELSYEEISPLGFPMFWVNTITVDKAKGDIYLTGEYGDTTVDFDPGPDVYHMTPYYSELDGMYNPSVFILKLDANGDFKWAKSLDIYNGGSISACVANSQAEGGLIYFAGNLTPLTDFDTYDKKTLDFDPGPGVAPMKPNNWQTFPYLFTLNAEGEFQWVKALGVPEEDSPEFADWVTLKMAIDEEGELYCTAVIRGDLDIDPGEETGMLSGNGSLSLINYTGDGDLDWIKQGEMGINVSGGVEVPSWLGYSDLSYNNNSLYVAYSSNGSFNADNTIEFGGTSTVDVVYQPGIDIQSVSFARFDVDGNFKWIKQLAGEDTANRASAPKISASNNKIMLTGQFNNVLDLDPGSAVTALSAGKSFIALYDSLGNFEWGSKVAETEAGVYLYTNNVSLAYPNVYYAGTWMYGNMDADITEAEFTLTPFAETGYSTFITKIRLNEEDSPSSLASLNTITAAVFPNPNPGSLQVQLNKAVQNGTVVISSIAGQQVFVRKGLNGEKFTFDISNLPAGNYLLELSAPGARANYKLTKR